MANTSLAETEFTNTGASHNSIYIPKSEYKYGATRCQVEPIYKRGKIDKLLITFRQCPQLANKIFTLNTFANDILIDVDNKNSTFMGWCKEHKTTFVNFIVNQNILLTFSKTSSIIIMEMPVK